MRPTCPEGQALEVATHCVSDCVDGAGQLAQVLTWARVAPVSVQADHPPMVAGGKVVVPAGQL